MAFLLILPLPVHAQTGWQPIEEIQSYPITGDSGVALYASIGENGPKVGTSVRAIALTNFKLTWTRNYQPQPNGACTLVSARPRLVITYTLPKPPARMSAEMKGRWDVFIAGIRRHEHVHGATIVSMVREIERVSVGLSAPNDPQCTKVRADLQAKLGEISKAQRQSSVDFDKVEMSDGGNVHRLILQLINAK